jgi:hypothetical protein
MMARGAPRPLPKAAPRPKKSEDKMEENLKGLLKTHKEFTFLKQQDLLRFYIGTFYPDTTVAVIYDCKDAVETVPRLSILKRDNYFAYIKATKSDFIIVKCNSVTEGEDWLFSFRMELKWEIYKNNKLVRNNKGKV